MNYVKGDTYKRPSAEGRFVYNGKKWEVWFGNRHGGYTCNTVDMEDFVFNHRDYANRNNREADYPKFYPANSLTVNTIRSQWVCNELR